MWRGHQCAGADCPRLEQVRGTSLAVVPSLCSVLGACQWGIHANHGPRNGLGPGSGRFAGRPSLLSKLGWETGLGAMGPAVLAGPGVQGSGVGGGLGGGGWVWVKVGCRCGEGLGLACRPTIKCSAEEVQA